MYVTTDKPLNMMLGIKRARQHLCEMQNMKKIVVIV